MILKRELNKKCKIDVQILETLHDGLVLKFMDNNIVDSESLDAVEDFIKKNNLNMLLDDGVYLISEQILTPYEPTYSE